MRRRGRVARGPGTTFSVKGFDLKASAYVQYPKRFDLVVVYGCPGEVVDIFESEDLYRIMPVTGGKALLAWAYHAARWLSKAIGAWSF